MKRIYEGARSVAAWLGWPDDEEENELVIAKMRELNSILHDAQAANSGDPLAANTTLSGDDKRLFDAPGSKCRRAWNGILAIARRKWRGWTWIVQEATVPEDSEGKTWFFLALWMCLGLTSPLRFPWVSTWTQSPS